MEFKETSTPPASTRQSWPFKNMDIGDTVETTGKSKSDLEKVRAYAHSHGLRSKKKFRTQIKGMTIYVTRVE